MREIMRQREHERARVREHERTHKMQLHDTIHARFIRSKQRNCSEHSAVGTCTELKTPTDKTIRRTASSTQYSASKNQRIDEDTSIKASMSNQAATPIIGTPREASLRHSPRHTLCRTPSKRPQANLNRLHKHRN